jgi:hypothetical protein
MSLVHPAGRLTAEQARDLAALEAREQEVAATLWAPEMQAQRCGRTIEALWDALNRAPLADRLRLVAEVSPGTVVLPAWGPAEPLPHGLEHRSPAGSRPPLASDAWRGQLEAWAAAGWQVLQLEFRHVRFTPAVSGTPARSEFLFGAHLVHALRPDRVALSGTLLVDWGEPSAGEDRIPIARLDAATVGLDRRSAAPPFEPVLEQPIETARDSSLVDPLIVHDLDRDGFSEILLAGRNLVFRRRPEGGYRSETLCRTPSGPVLAAVLGDFDGDGAVDLLAMQWAALVLFPGTLRGTFEAPARLAWPAPPDLRFAMGLTAGDIDEDGDLDVFLAQYKVSYENGSMPTPWHDATDGHPAHLLRNDGSGTFTDVTPGSGLEAKARRRSYGASLADLDADGHLDLVVISDFAGVDVYQGDGRGRFVDRTADWIPERRAFGMAHALSDFDRDGRLDLLMMGMPSATASRLDHLGLWRPESTEDRSLRARMTRGNRLYLAREPGGFAETPLSDSIARSGWSWGCSALDFDNDGYPEVYVANGLESRESVRDYESEFWLHDIHVNGSEENTAAYVYFMAKFGRTRGRGQSYGGYEKNRFYLNRQGTRFVEVGHLFGLALEADSRNVVSDDLDGDGRLDLVMTCYETWPRSRQVLRVYRNTLPDPGNWIGFRFPVAPRSTPPAGVRVDLETTNPASRSVRTLVNGDSHRSQHADAVHFGLGTADRVARARIHWPGGATLVLTNPAPGRYHAIPAPPDLQGRPLSVGR